MRKFILAALISAGLLAEGVVPVASAATASKTTQSSNKRSRGRHRARGGAILGRGRGAGAGAVLGGTAGALMPTRRNHR
jgi:hypothetical protein